MSWNGFPNSVKNRLINRSLKRQTSPSQITNNEKLDDTRPKI